MGILALTPPTRPPRPLIQRERPNWDPLSSDGAVPAPPVQRASLPHAPRETRTPPEQAPPSGAQASQAETSRESRISLRGADGGGNPESRAPSAPRALPGQRHALGAVECRTIQSSLAPPQRPPLNLSPPTPRACAPAPTPRSAPQLPGPAGPTLAPASAPGGTGCTCDPPSCRLRLWAPALCQARRDQRPGHERRWTEGPGRGDTHTPRNSLSRQLRPSIGQVGSYQAPSSKNARQPGGRSPCWKEP